MFVDISSQLADKMAEIIDGEELWPTRPEAEVHDAAPTIAEMIESGEIETVDEVFPEDTAVDEAENADEAEEAITPEETSQDGDFSESMTTDREAAVIDSAEAEAAKEKMKKYNYLHLSKSSRRLYREIYTVLANQTEAVTLEEKDTDEIDKVFGLVNNDHPEFFYVTGYSLNKYMVGDEVTSIEFEGTYDRSKEEADALLPCIDEYAEKCFAELPDTGCDYDKVRYIYEYIIDNTEYDLDAADNQNIISVFKNGKSVCQGYAKATQYLLQKAGIPCFMIAGTVEDNAPHAWNIAYVDGKWTYIDTTWGDASYRNITTGDTWNEITYDYLCVGDEELADSHHAESKVKLPKAKKIKN